MIEAVRPGRAGAAAFVGRVVQTRGAGFGLVVLAVVCFVALAADVAAPYNPNQVGTTEILAAPSLGHPLGGDQLGRDVLSRVIHGARVSLQAGVVSVGISLFLGVFIGLIAGYYGGLVDDILMRLIDTLWSFPALVLALAIAASLGPGLTNAMIAIGIVFTPTFARLVRGQTLSVREREFVTAARVLGARPWRIMLRHIWPNVTAPVVVQASLMVAMAIIVEASLSFLGLGVEPPNASWGSMLKTGYQYMEQAPWLSFAPGAAIFVTVLAFNLVGDGLRRALDPRLWQRGES
ncbi:MAG: ABC transporter permease [Chloroflexi bacterium]|nr:ABC transporter permease [Chloroflexota bacterium]